MITFSLQIMPLQARMQFADANSLYEAPTTGFKFYYKLFDTFTMVVKCKYGIIIITKHKPSLSCAWFEYLHKSG